MSKIDRKRLRRKARQRVRVNKQLRRLSMMLTATKVVFYLNGKLVASNDIVDTGRVCALSLMDASSSAYTPVGCDFSKIEPR